VSAQSSDKKQSPDPLAIRLSVSRWITRRVGSDYQKVVAGVEANLPDGLDIVEGLDRMDSALRVFLKEEGRPRTQQ